MKEEKSHGGKAGEGMIKNSVGVPKKIWNTILACIVVYASMFLWQLLVTGLMKMPKEALDTAVQYFIFIFLWIPILAFLLIGKNRLMLKAVGHAARGNNWKKLLIGFGIGFGMNAFCVLAAVLHKDIVLYFICFQPYSLLIIFLAVFIQSSAEEMLCRVFLYQRLIKNWHPAVAVLGNGVIFALMHLGNEGITVLSCLNLVVVSTMFSLMVYYMDSVWCAMAAHTAWNFTQNILFGLPNSGSPSAYSVFGLDASAARNSFAYDTGFGIEGTWVSTIVIVLVCIAIWQWGSRHGKKPYDVWSAGLVSGKKGQAKAN